MRDTASGATLVAMASKLARGRADFSRIAVRTRRRWQLRMGYAIRRIGLLRCSGGVEQI